MLRRRSFAFALLLTVVGCKADAQQKLHVLAAASLTDALPPVAEAWSKMDGGMPVELVFDSTSRLAAQIEGGAPADVFLSADREWMDKLEGQGLLVADTRHDLLGNRLVVVVQADATNVPASVDDLRSVGRLALAGASVPAGKYARAALTSLGIIDAVASKIVEGDNVRTALGWVAKGEADAAVVYATDAKTESRVKVVLELPAASHPAIVYPVAALAQGKHAEAARSFVEHVRADAAQTSFREAGFSAPP